MSETRKIKKTIRIDQESASGLSAFTERPMPTEHEVASFERVVDREVREQEMESHLTEIYRDKKGRMVDVKKMTVKKRQLVVIKMFKRLLIVSLLSLVSYFAYFYFFARGNDMGGLEFSISAPERMVAGEEISYEVEYYNPTKFAMSRIKLELTYPENFIFSSSSIAPTNSNYGFDLPNLPSGGRYSVTVRGIIIDKTDAVKIISGRLNYIPLNFSSEFKKESSDATIVSGNGFQIGVDSPGMAFVNQDNELSLSFFDVSNNYFGDFNLEFALPEGATINLDNGSNEKNASSSDDKAVNTAGIFVATPSSTKMLITPDVSGKWLWLISNLDKNTALEKINFKYQMKNQPVDAQIIIRLSKKLADGKKIVFWEQVISPEIIKSDLNLTLFLNGSKNNGAASFGDTLSYTLNYSNKGENTFKDAVIMAVLTNPFLDWTALKMEQDGDVRTGKMIVWTKKDIPALAEVRPGDEGEIIFTIPIKNYQDGDFGKDLQISAYSQYGVNNKESAEGQNKSNVILTKINSDLSLAEEIRYFDDNNSPVGSGPLPPIVGQKSSFKVYWTVKNNLHEIRGAEVVLNLPAQVKWDAQSSVSTGSIYYDENKHAVIWNIGLLPVSIYQANASFSISVTPSISDQDKILILSPGATITASDNETQSLIIKKTTPKTTRLEDDDIANLNNPGRVQ
jgi:uncharacterized repeat protein (TIGR01451 family)